MDRLNYLMSNKGLIFVRNSSGLTKKVSLLDAVMLNIGNMSAGLVLFTAVTPLDQPGALLWVTSIIGFIFAIPQLIVYTLLNKEIQRTGGDYIWISRILNGPLGAVMAMILMFQSAAFFALTAFFFSSAVQSVLQLIGEINSIPSLLSLSNIIVSPIYSYIIGAIAFTVFIAINIFKAKWGYSVITSLGIISVSITILAFIILVIHMGDFKTAIIPFLKATKSLPPSSYYVPGFSWASTLAMLPVLALFAYPWMQAGPAVSAEFKSSKIVNYNILLALVFTGIIITLGLFILYYEGGYCFTTYEFINNGYVYNFWSVAIGLSNNYILEWILGIGLMSWELLVLSYGVLVFSRYIFALAFDRVLPEIFTKLNQGGSPVYTHLFDLILTLLFLILPVISINGALALYGTTFIGATYFLIVSIAGVKYGLTKNKILLLVASIISTGYFAYLDYQASTNPLFGFMESNGSINVITLIFAIILIIGGVLTYIIAYLRNKARGIDINMVYKEIPPE